MLLLLLLLGPFFNYTNTIHTLNTAPARTADTKHVSREDTCDWTRAESRRVDWTRAESRRVDWTRAERDCVHLTRAC